MRIRSQQHLQHTMHIVHENAALRQRTAYDDLGEPGSLTALR